jgi:hypothetical protein
VKGNKHQPFIGSIFGHKLVEMGQILREVSVEFKSAKPTYLRAIQSDEIVPTECVNKILENFRIETSYIDTQTIHYLAIGRHVIWMLCGQRIVPITGPSHADCGDILIQAHIVNQSQENATPQPTPIVGLHQAESKLEQDIRGDAKRLLERCVGQTERTDFDGYLGFACISKRAAINLPCDRLVEITDSEMDGGLMVRIPERF